MKAANTPQHESLKLIRHRQPEVSGRLAAGEIERVLASADEFDYGEGEVGELFRVGFASPREEGFEGNPPVPARNAMFMRSGLPGTEVAQFHRHAPQ